MDKITFARWSWERDVKMDFTKLAYAGDVRFIYEEEAAYYLTLKRSEWPCGILLRMGAEEHVHYHVGCPTTDLLE